VIQPWDLAKCKEAVQRGEKILVVANTALGDSILCTPLLRSLSKELGSERVGFLVRNAYVDLYKGVPWIGKVFGVQGKYRGFGKLKAELEAEGYRIALVANATEPDLIPLLWKSGIRGFLRFRNRWSEWPEWFANRSQMRSPDSPDYATGHAIENNLAMMEALEIPVAVRQLIYEHPDLEVKLPSFAPRYMVVHPGASRAEKRWPLENWSRIIQALTKEFSVECVLTGSREEIELASELKHQIGSDVLNLAGQLSLPEMARLLRSASIFMSGDTGPYHLAVAVGCPTVTLFAPRDRGSSSEACGPHYVDLTKHVACQTKRFHDPIMMIDMESVGLAAFDILKRYP
jgi:heptosyltransferase-3